MHKILDYVKNHEDAWPFVDPVEEEYAPNYYSVIRKPMDLQRMEERLDSGYYKSFSKFRADFQLIINNCRLYNGVDNGKTLSLLLLSGLPPILFSEYTEMVGNLEQVFQKATQRYLDQLSSSDEEIAVEFPKSIKSEKPATSTSKRKPTLVANTGKKRERSISESSHGQLSNSAEPEETTEPVKGRGSAERKINKQNSNATKKHKVEKRAPEIKLYKRKGKPGRKPVVKKSPSISPCRGRSPSRSPSLHEDRWSSSPPPSWPPSSPEIKEDVLIKRKNSPLYTDPKSKTKGKYV